MMLPSPCLASGRMGGGAVWSVAADDVCANDTGTNVIGLGGREGLSFPYSGVVGLVFTKLTISKCGLI